jgi:hypothetical protein
MSTTGSEHRRSVDPAVLDAGHRRALVLSEVAVEGPIGLYRVLRRAAAGDPDAAGLTVSALVRALPGVGAYDTHDLLALAHIPSTVAAGDLTPGQRVALATQLDRALPPDPL